MDKMEANMSSHANDYSIGYNDALDDVLNRLVDECSRENTLADFQIFVLVEKLRTDKYESMYKEQKDE